MCNRDISQQRWHINKTLEVEAKNISNLLVYCGSSDIGMIYSTQTELAQIHTILKYDSEKFCDISVSETGLHIFSIGISITPPPLLSLPPKNHLQTLAGRVDLIL